MLNCCFHVLVTRTNSIHERMIYGGSCRWLRNCDRFPFVFQLVGYVFPLGIPGCEHAFLFKREHSQYQIGVF